MNLSICDQHLREMLHALARQDIQAIHNNSQVWCKVNTSLLAKSRIALTILDDSKIAHLVESLFSHNIEYEKTLLLAAELNVYYLYVVY